MSFKILTHECLLDGVLFEMEERSFSSFEEVVPLSHETLGLELSLLL